MKGTLSMWVWIVGGVIAGFLIFVIAYTQLIGTAGKITEQRTLEQYTELKNKINDLCWSYSESENEYRIIMNENVEGIYLTNNTDREEKNLQEKILSKNISSGDILCIKIKNQRIRCSELDCDAQMPFIGAVPEEYSLSALIDKIMNRRKRFEYDLSLVRKDYVIISLKSEKNISTASSTTAEEPL